MTIKESKAELNDFVQKIVVGMARANRKMAEKAAANNENLIVADKDGKPISVPAKELLKNLAD